MIPAEFFPLDIWWQWTLAGSTLFDWKKWSLGTQLHSWSFLTYRVYTFYCYTCSLTVIVLMSRKQPPACLICVYFLNNKVCLLYIMPTLIFSLYYNLVFVKADCTSGSKRNWQVNPVFLNLSNIWNLTILSIENSFSVGLRIL